MTKKHTGWIASMSTGETIFQKPDAEGERSEWGKLLERCVIQDIYISQIQLQMAGMTILALGNADGYCAVYEDHFAFARSPGTESSKLPRKITYQGVGAVYGDFVLLTFANDFRTIWTDIRTLDLMRPHCQLKSQRAQARRRSEPRARLAASVLAEQVELEEELDSNLSVVSL